MANQNFRVKNGLEVGTGVTISAGVVTASSFVGSGSQLTNITANYSNISGVSSSVVGGAVSATSLNITGVSTFDGAVKIRNGYNLNIGDNNDLRIYNDGTESRIEETGSGSLYISGSDINIQQHSANKNFARFIGGGAAELYYDNNKKLSTSGIGVTVTGTLVADQINISGVATFQNSVYLGDTDFIYFGDSSDLYIGHNGSVSAIADSGTGDLYIAGDNSLIITDLSYVENKAKFNTNGSVELYYDNVKKLETLGVGVTVAGTTFTDQLSVSGIITATSVVKSGGTSSQFLKADGSVDSSTYLTSYTETDTLNSVTNRGNSTSNGINVGVLTATSVRDTSGNVRAIPQNSQTSAYILAASDIGKHISITTGGVTINTGIFSAGDAVSIYNNSGSNQTITQGTSVTLRSAGTANTGNRTLAQYGVCTVLCVGSETFVISGAGLS